MNDPAEHTSELMRQARLQLGHDDARAGLLYEQAITAARARGERILLAEALNNLARLEHERGESNSALVHLEEALALRDVLGDREGAAVVLCNLGAVHLDLGSFNTALEHLLRADTLAETGPPARIASVAANLARTYDALGTPAEALAQFKRAQSLAHEAGHPVGEAIIAINQADLLRRQAQFADAEALLEHALDLVGRDNALAASALYTLGQLRRDEGRPAQALAAFREAVTLAEADRDLDALLDARCGVAEALLDLGCAAQALAPLDAAECDAEGGGRARSRVRALSLRVRALEALGDPTKALAVLREAHQTETHVLRAEAERRTRELFARGELEKARARLEREQARYEAEREAKEKLAREQAERLEELEHLALYDALTGLPNRLLLAERVRAALEGAAMRGERIALGVLDLNKFKAVNDTHGHHVGDLLLQAVAQRLPHALGTRDTVARTGGDEFVFLTFEADEAELLELSQRILRAFDEPFFLQDVELAMRPSLGFARYPDDAADMARLLECADHAMYRAKARGSGFELGVAGAHLAPATLESALHGALRSGEMHLLYQPLEDASGAWRSAEALLRWRSPVYGNVTPDQFMPLAERSGLSLPLSEWTLKCACEMLARLPSLSVAVNISARQLTDPSLAGLVERHLREVSVEPARLTLEVREDAVAQAPERSRAALDALAGSGVRVTLDDFGGGHANFAELSRLPVHAVKLDRALVQRMDEGPRGMALLGAVVNLARALDLDVIAKGVETDVQRAALRAFGVRQLQGFLVSPPLEAGALCVALEREGTRELA